MLPKLGQFGLAWLLDWLFFTSYLQELKKIKFISTHSYLAYLSVGPSRSCRRFVSVSVDIYSVSISTLRTSNLTITNWFTIDIRKFQTVAQKTTKTSKILWGCKLCFSIMLSREWLGTMSSLPRGFLTATFSSSDTWKVSQLVGWDILKELFHWNPNHSLLKYNTAVEIIVAFVGS